MHAAILIILVLTLFWVFISTVALNMHIEEIKTLIEKIKKNADYVGEP